MKTRVELYNWFQLGKNVFGEVKGHPRFSDGTVVQLSRILTRDDYSIETENTIYTLGKKQEEHNGFTKLLQGE